MWVTIKAQNEGQVALRFLPTAPQRLLVSQADNAIWRDACDLGGPISWESSSLPLARAGLAAPEGELLDPPEGTKDLIDLTWRQRWLTRRGLLLLLDGEKLEPGEQWARSALLKVERDSLIYLLRAEISACKHVALRHLIWHLWRCRGTKSSYKTWSREIYILAKEGHKNGYGSAFRAAGIRRRAKKGSSLP